MDGVLGLRAGELVEVKSEEEILRTLDSRGTLESMPFMPEMLPFCGKRFRVSKRADKACDTIEWKQLRRMENAVHLEDLRCDGTAHGGCQAGCLIYWKEAWLRRVAEPSEGDPSSGSSAVNGDGRGEVRPARMASFTRETLQAATRTPQSVPGNEIFSCQATELLRATAAPLPWWEPTQYIRDVRSGNAGVVRVIRSIAVGFFNKLQQANMRLLPRHPLIRGGKPYPFLHGRASGDNAAGAVTLDLQPGDLVEVRSKEEILETLDARDRTRGLRFDTEMLRYCGRRGRVLRRIEQIIDEGTGKMIRINTDCIVIEGFVCTGDYHRLCPRRIFPYWREAWLKRVE